MSHQFLSIINNHTAFRWAITVAILAGCILADSPSSWGGSIEEYHIDQKMAGIEPPASLVMLYGYLRLGAFREVVEKGNALLEADPTTPAYGLLSVAYAGLGQFDEASEAIQKAKDASESATFFIHISRGMIYHGRKEYDAAITESSKAIKLDAQHPLAYATLGAAYVGKQNYEKAEENFKKAAAIAPEYATAYTLLGTSYAAQGKIQEAITTYEKATELAPQDSRPRMGLATIYIGMGKYDKAANEYKTVLTFAPASSSVRLQLSALLLRTGEHDDAIVEATEVLARVDSPPPEVYLTLGHAHAFKHQFDEAIKHLNQLASLQPNSFQAQYLLGLCMIAKGDLKSARKRFQKAGQIDLKQVAPAIAIGIMDHLEGDFHGALAQFDRVMTISANATDPRIHFLMANVHLSQKEVNQAEAHLKKAKGFILRFQANNLNLKPYSDKASPVLHANINLAALYLFTRWWDKAIEMCDSVLTAHASYPIALYLKGQAFKGKGDMDGAIVQFQRIAESTPQFISPHHELAELYLSIDSIQEAINAYLTVIELSPKDAFAHLALGAIYEKDGQDAAAIHEYRQVIELAPDSALGYNQLAYFYAEKERNLDQALTLALKAVQLAPKSGGILDTLCWIYLKQKNYSRAIDGLTLAVEKSPNVPSIRYHLGVAYFEIRDWENALKVFEEALRVSQYFSRSFPEADDTQAMIQTIKGR